MQKKHSIGILGATGMVGQRFIQLLEDHPWFQITWLAASDRSSGKFRMTPDVPLVSPEVNAEHLHLIEEQVWRRNHGGYMVTNPNCSAIGLVLALKPIEERFGIEKILVTTMQAVSGAGYPGVPSMDILGNVVPYIGSEEEKMEAETLKLLGRLEGRSVRPLAAAISAHCNRVAVEDGHTESVSIKLGNKLGRPVTQQDLLSAWAEFRPLSGQNLPMAPQQPVEWAPQSDRPQPRLDRNRGRGMAVTVGRLRPCNVLDWKFTVLSHNTIRGAAGAAILNAELLASLGKLEPAVEAAHA
jgi:aspartate-semialdehyde dehydrogenase